jgi:DNA invertase Pin-like site-specific DNA recombinase
MLGRLAEFEQELIRSHTGDGHERAAVNSVRLGRKPMLTHHQQLEAIKRCNARKEALGGIAAPTT